MDAKLTIDLNNLSETEKQVICNVLKRDDDLRKLDEQRILRLKSELQWLRRRGAIRGGLDPMTSCARCRCQLGKILNRGSPCPVCRAKVCKSCRIYARDGVQWFCVVCHKQLEIEAATGEWMNEFVRRASRHRDRKAGFVSPAEIVRATISRSYTTRENKATNDNHGKGGPRRATAVASSLNRDLRGPSLMDRRQGKASALSVSPELSLPPSPEISRSPRSPKDRSPPPPSPSSQRNRQTPPLASPRQKSPLLKQKAVILDQDIIDQNETTTTTINQLNSTAIPSVLPRRRPPPGAPHHPSDRSDSGIGPDSATPLTPRSPKAYSIHSETVHSRQSSSCSSGQGGGGAASWRTTTESGATDSELSDSEVEPSTGVVFRKVSLKRRKHKDGRHASYGQCSSTSPSQTISMESETPSQTPQLPLNPSRFHGDLAPQSEGNLIRTNSDDCFWWAGGEAKESADARASFLRSFLDSSSDSDRENRGLKNSVGLSRSLEVIPSVDSDEDHHHEKDLYPPGLSSSWTSGDESFQFDGRRWNNIWFGSPDFEEDFLADCCGTAGDIHPSDSCSDILCNIHDKIVPEGSEYRIVFISSSSSKSSGLNSGGEDGSSSPSVRLMDDCDWEASSPVTDSPPPLPLAPPPVLPPGALDNLSPTYSLEEEYAEFRSSAAVTSACDGGDVLLAAGPSLPFGPFTLLAAELSDFEPSNRDMDVNSVESDDGCSTSVSVLVVSEIAENVRVAEVGEPESGLGTLFSDLDSVSTDDSYVEHRTTISTAPVSKEMDSEGEMMQLVKDVDAQVLVSSEDSEILQPAKDADAQVEKVNENNDVEPLESEDEFCENACVVDVIPESSVVIDDDDDSGREDIKSEDMLSVGSDVTCDSSVTQAAPVIQEGLSIEKVDADLGKSHVDELIDSKSENEIPEIRIVKPAADLHQLIAQSRALRDSGNATDHQNLEESAKTSVLEKYFVTTLEQTAPPKSGRLNRPHLLKSTHNVSDCVVPVGRSATDVEAVADVSDQQSDTDDGDEDLFGSENCDESTNDEDDDDDSDNSEDSTNGEDDSETTAFDSDSDSTVSSTSSDEGTIYLKMTPTTSSTAGHDSNFRSNLDMSLHTIVEESCEESESERSAEERNLRRRDAAARLSDPSELERYYRYTFESGFGNTTVAGQSTAILLASSSEISAGGSDAESMSQLQSLGIISLSGDGEFSDDTMSETGSSCFSETTDVGDDVDDDELARLASSRLEKYFLTGFLGMDAAFGLGIRTLVDGNTAIYQNASTSNEHAIETSIVDNAAGVMASANKEIDEIPFEKNDGCDTIKRKKKEVADGVSDSDDGDDVLRAIARILRSEDVDETKDVMISNDVCEKLNIVSMDDQYSDASTMDTTPILLQEQEMKESNDEECLDATDELSEQPADKDLKWNAVQSDNNPCVDSPYLGVGRSLNLDWKQQSRDSGFIGSNDDLLIREKELEDEDVGDGEEILQDAEAASEKGLQAFRDQDIIKCLLVEPQQQPQSSSASNPPPLSTVSSSSSIFGQFRGSARSTRSNRSARSNFCTSDDEAQYIVNQLVTQIAKSMARSPQLSRAKPPEIEVFEEELTKLMQSVPGIDATVKELVEELSSTDYCSDSYESSDYTSSDQETQPFTFEVHKAHPFPVGFNPLRRNDSGRSWRSSTSTASKTSSLDGGQLSSEETMFIYQRFMDSLTKMAEHVSDDAGSIGGCGSESSKSGNRSPPTFTKIVTHIRDKVTSLMREVQGSPKLSGCSGELDLGPQNRRKIVWKKPGSGCGDELSSISSTTSSMTFDSEDSPTDTELSIDSDDPAAANVTGPFHALNQAKAIVEMSLGGKLQSGFRTPTGMTTPDDEAARSTSDGLERWSSDMTIVDDDVRFTSVHKSEPMLSIPDDSQAEDKRHSLSFDNRLASRIGGNGFPSNSLQQRHHSAEQQHQCGGSSGSLYWSSKEAKRKCRSEWEMWRASDSADDVNCSSQTISSATLSANKTPPTHKSCDLLPSVRSKTSTESKSTTTVQVGLYQQHGSTSSTSSKDRRKHGLTYLWRQKSGSSTSLREGPVAASESASIKQQIQYRSSHQLQSVKKKEEHQQRYHWPFNSSKHKDSKWSSSVKSCLSSPENLSGVGVEGVSTTTTAADTWDGGDSDGVRLLSHRSLDTTSNPIVKPHPLGHRTMPWSLSSSSSSSSTKATSSKNFPSNQPSSSSSLSSSFWSKASTLPRAAGPSDLSFVPNVSFLHKSNRCLLTANNKYSRLLSPQPVPPPLPYSHSWSLSSPTASTSFPSVPEQDVRRNSNTMMRQQQPVSAVASAREPPTPSPRASTVASGVLTKNLESPKFRREVRSWPDENNPSLGSTQNTVSTDPQSGGGHRSSKQVLLTTPVETAKFIPNISVVEYSEKGVPRVTASHAGSSDHESMAEEDIDRLVALHKNRSLSSLGVCSESMSSVYSAAGGGHYGNVTVRGEAEFGLGYNYVSGALEVTVKQCRDLAPVDVKRSRSDPYVKVYLLPDKSKSGKRKTRVKKHTLNPTFNEVLKFNVTISELETRTLWLTVWHSDMFGRNEFLGEVTLPMGYEAFDDSSPKWYLLQERLGPPEEVFSYKGDLVVALRFVPPDVTNQKRGQRRKGSLHVLVKEARNLMAVSANGTSDPFCKCYLLPDKGKSNKQKTQVVKRSCHPKWNHTFVYEDVSLESLWERCLELTVWDYDRLTSNDFLGGVRLSLGTGKYQGKKVDWMDSRGEEVSVWQTVLERPNVWVDSIVLLRPTMDHRQTSSL